MRKTLMLMTGFGLILLLLGYTGRYLPFGDALAVGRVQVLAVLFLVGLALLAFREMRAGAVALAAGVFCGVPILSQGKANVDIPADGYTLYQKNLLAVAWPREGLAEDIIASGADIVTLQEVTEHNLFYMKPMFDAYPHQVFCGFPGERSVAILTRLPVIEGTIHCDPENRAAWLQVSLPDGKPMWVMGVHLFWPYPYPQSEQVDTIVTHLAGLDGRKLVSGDFNNVPWASVTARIEEAAGAERTGAYRTTFPMFGPLVPLPIDQVLLPRGATGHSTLRPLGGSDHLGVLTRFSL